jgi:hypothetical protein
MAETQQTHALQRVTEYPVVKSSLQTAYNLAQSNSYSSRALSTASDLSNSLLNRLAPVLPIQTADKYGNLTLDYVEKTFPVVKEETDVLVQRVRAPAEQSIAIAKSYSDELQLRFTPVTDQINFVGEQINSRIAQTQSTLLLLQDRIVATVQVLPRDKASAAEAINSLYKEVEGLTSYVGTTIKDLPAHAQTASKPYLDGLAEGVSYLREELGKDIPLSTKAQNVASYAREKLQPLLGSIKDLIIKSRNVATDDANAAANTVGVNGVQTNA